MSDPVADGMLAAFKGQIEAARAAAYVVKLDDLTRCLSCFMPHEMPIRIVFPQRVYNRLLEQMLREYPYPIEEHADTSWFRWMITTIQGEEE